MTLAYKHVLVAVDGSDEAEWAFKKATGIAKRNEAVLNLIYIVDTRSFTGVKLHEPDIEEQAYDYGKELLDSYKQEAQAIGVSEVHTFLTPGSPKKVISRDYAKKVEADLIVCGATGMNAFERYLMGSVSLHIVRNSSCDVLVVRRPETE
ncbi:nucleotide-binding universal stress UspA family protein [Planomicrobium sp. HSC-17F08]|nr:nucleotide-binding universal stress UspA family protein [Planomicrobium sp. HSC-17F08]